VVTGPVAPLSIPTSLHASLLARLDRLAPTREVAQIGAALGRQFSHELISAVAEMPQRQVDDALEQLASAELIFRRGTPPDAEYTFKHALVQDAAYGTLLRGRRQQIHARVAVTMESHFPEIVAAQPHLLAQHCSEAGLNDKAIGYWLKAGQHAVARSAMTEAVVQLQKGLNLLATLPDDPNRRQQELDLLIMLGQAQMATRGGAAPEVTETFARAGVLAEQLNRSDHLIVVLHSQWVAHLIRSQFKPALSQAEQMEKMGRAQNDPTMLLMGRQRQGLTRLLLGEFVAARALFDQCHELSNPTIRERGRMPEDPYALMLGQLSRTMACLGYLDQGRARTNQALLESRQLRHAHTLAFALIYACGVEWVANSPCSVQRHAEEVVNLSKEQGFPFWLSRGMIYLGWSLTSLDEAREGVALLTRGLAAYRATGAVIDPHALVLLAEAYAKVRRPVEGLNYLNEAAQIIETTDERISEADLHRLRGDLLNAVGDRAAGEQSYHQALAIAKRQSAKIFELRAATSLARLWRDQGKRTEARDLLASIYGWFTEGFDTPVLQDAKALLDELAHQERS
jgi:tetratricopeptide (TPR) repeat protein